MTQTPCPRCDSPDTKPPTRTALHLGWCPACGTVWTLRSRQARRVHAAPTPERTLEPTTTPILVPLAPEAVS